MQTLQNGKMYHQKNSAANRMIRRQCHSDIVTILKHFHFEDANAESIFLCTRIGQSRV